MALPSDINSREYAKFYEIGTGTPALFTAQPFLTISATATIGSGKTAGTVASTASGLMYKVSQGVGTLSGTPGTITTYLKDSLGGTIATLTAQAESSTVTYSTIVPLTTDMSWVTIATGDPDGTQTAAAGVPVSLKIHFQV